MRSMLVCLVLSFPASASAQPVFAESAFLHVVDGDGEHEVGWLRGGPSVITGWPQADHVELHFEDEIVSFDARVDLGASDTALLATPAQAVTLEPARAFRVEMLVGTFARVTSRDAVGRLRVRLPDTLPHRTASMPMGSPAAHPTGPEILEVPDDASWESICRPTRVFSRPSSGASVWVVDGPSTRAQVGPARHGFRPVRVWIDGYVVHGFLDRALPTDVGCGGGSFGTSCGGGFSSVRTRITLPAGTALFGSPSATERFATLRAPHLATMIERGPIPDAPTVWHLTRDEEQGARWSLEVWLHASADTLRSYPSPPR